MYINLAELIVVSHVAKRGKSLRITIPEKVADALKVKEENIVGFYKEGNRAYVKLTD